MITTLNIQHENYGKILTMGFTDAVQTKLFLKMVNDSIDNKTAFRYFDLSHTLYHIPHKILVECLITTETELVSYSEQVLAKVAEIK
jgi:hypothetical protein